MKVEATMNPDELRQIKVDKVVDARGVACPGPLLEAKRAVPSVPLRGVMEVVSSDIGTTEDIPLWAKKVGHEYLGTIPDAGLWHVYLRRGK
ncbi:MAG TPA: sulfurtransferase TusA family protein [Thermoplasmata archaeon]|nr:sulfurtransferase TusA family protein [Thermoplasmata archaeon]